MHRPRCDQRCRGNGWQPGYHSHGTLLSGCGVAIRLLLLVEDRDLSIHHQQWECIDLCHNSSKQRCLGFLSYRNRVLGEHQRIQQLRGRKPVRVGQTQQRRLLRSYGVGGFCGALLRGGHLDLLIATGGWLGARQIRVQCGTSNRVGWKQSESPNNPMDSDRNSDKFRDL